MVRKRVFVTFVQERGIQRGETSKSECTQSNSEHIGEEIFVLVQKLIATFLD